MRLVAQRSHQIARFDHQGFSTNGSFRACRLLSFTVWGKTGGGACSDVTIKLKPVADRRLQGTVGTAGMDGTIKLVRR